MRLNLNTILDLKYIKSVSEYIDSLPIEGQALSIQRLTKEETRCDFIAILKELAILGVVEFSEDMAFFKRKGYSFSLNKKA